MISVPSPVAGIRIAQDPADGTWMITSTDPVQEHRLRPWRWGERRRMVRAAARDGPLDGAHFVTSVTATLYDPAPPPTLVPLYAYIALDLLGLGRGSAPSPLGAAEARLAAQFGWLPSAVDTEPAAELDSLLAALPPSPQGATEPGWSSIRVMDQGDG